MSLCNIGLVCGLFPIVMATLSVGQSTSVCVGESHGRGGCMISVSPGPFFSAFICWIHDSTC